MYQFKFLKILWLRPFQKHKTHVSHWSLRSPITINLYHLLQQFHLCLLNIWILKSILLDKPIKWLGYHWRKRIKWSFYLHQYRIFSKLLCHRFSNFLFLYHIQHIIYGHHLDISHIYGLFLKWHKDLASCCRITYPL